jgi:IS4 transposase
MAAKHCNEIRHTLKSLFPDQFLKDLASETGFVKRQRKISPVSFFWALVLGFGLERVRTISSLRKAFERSTNTTIAPSSFYDRFTEECTVFFKTALDQAFESFRMTIDQLGEGVKAFREIVFTDATVLKLHNALKNVYPGCRTNHSPAAAKLHAVVGVTGAGKSTVKITGERVSEKRKLVIGDWVSGKLLAFDLGYYKFQLFHKIVRHGGHFISRLKENANPKIVAVHVGSADFVGERLQDVLSGLRRDALDVDVEVVCTARSYKGIQSKTRATFRVVAIRDTETGDYHCYITSLSSDVASAVEVARIYAARWGIELLFKELKSGYRLDELDSQRKEVVDTLIYTALITLVTSRALMNFILSKIKNAERRIRATTGRWWKLFAAYAQEILLIVVRPLREISFLRGLVGTLLHELIDPHTKRKPLFAKTLPLSSP